MGDKERLLLADDVELIRDGLKARFEARTDHEVVAEAGTVGELAAGIIREKRPEALIISL